LVYIIIIITSTIIITIIILISISNVRQSFLRSTSARQEIARIVWAPEVYLQLSQKPAACPYAEPHKI
jgi:hypothetical protein